jgi:hypothetical protein
MSWTWSKSLTSLDWYALLIVAGLLYLLLAALAMCFFGLNDTDGDIHSEEGHSLGNFCSLLGEESSTV